MTISSIGPTMDLASMQSDMASQDAVLDKSQVSGQDREKLKDLSEQFESVFLDLIMQSMRKTVPKSELTDGGNGEEIFRSMLDQEYTKVMAKQRMTGIAATIEKDLLKVMEMQASAMNKDDGLKAYAGQGLREK